MTRLIRPYLIVTVIALIYALIVVVRAQTPLALVTIGAQFSPTEAQFSRTEGYDGQFVYFIARDPANADHLIAAGGDFPAYRYQRILLPALSWWLPLGETAIPWELLIINLIALGAGTWALEGLLTRRGASRWIALGYGLSLAALGSTRLTLTEPLAYGLVLVAFYLADQQRPLWQVALILALAAFAKETTLIFSAGYAFYWALQRQFGRALIVASITITPFIALQVALYARFGQFGVGSGGLLATPFEIVPWMGVIRILTEGGVAIFGVLMAFLLPFVILPTLWGLWRAWHDLRTNTITLWTVLLAINALILLFVPFSTYREPLGILRFIAGLQIAVIVYAAERKLRRPLRYSTLWAITSLIVIASDVG
ncbi:MAG: hypothetical protein MUF87_14220 [Anaerolineae bacterium]|jgi:hypothetical protein|nr:hypothetical protein [Anaerolineae bacterium]